LTGSALFAEKGVCMESEVTRILAQIDAEYEAAEWGLRGLALGRARHDFIAARTMHVSQLFARLNTLVGKEAITLIDQEFDKFPGLL
jgi:hypothetical protein